MKQIFGAILFFMTIAAPGAGFAGTWRVEQDGSGDFLTLQPAVDVSASGDTILVGAGWYKDLHSIPHAGSAIDVAAYWDVDKDLTFIGESAETVKIGPEDYTPYLDGPQGLFSENTGTIRIENFTFTSLYNGISAGGNTYVKECAYLDSHNGVAVFDATEILIEDCTFGGPDKAASFYRCASVVVACCKMEDAYVYFGGTANGVVDNCTFTGGMAANYYQSDGTFSNNTVEGGNDSCFGCREGHVIVRDNVFNGGDVGLDITGGASSPTLVEAYNNVFFEQNFVAFGLISYASLKAWNNDIYRHVLETMWLVYTMYYDNPSDAYVDVRNNFWGNDSREFELNRGIWDGNDDPDLHIIVEYMPYATESVKTEKKTMGGLKSMFR